MRNASTSALLVVLAALAPATGLYAAATIEWNSAVTSSDCYTNGANWVGGAAPTDGEVGVFTRALDDVTVTFPSSGIRENSTTKVCLHSGTADSHTITFDLTNGGYWVKTGSANYGSFGGLFFNDYLSADSPIFHIVNPNKAGGAMLFSITNSLIRWSGNMRSGLLQISGGELNFYDPENLDVGSLTRPSLASGNSTYQPITVIVDNGASLRAAAFDTRANGGNNLVRFSNGTSLMTAGDITVGSSGAYGVGHGNTVNSAKAGTNRFEAIGATISVGGALCASMGNTGYPFQCSEIVLSNSMVTAAGSFSPCGGVYTNETLVLIGGTSSVSVAGINMAYTAKAKNAGNRSRIEIGGTALFSTAGGNVLIGRDPGPGSSQRWIIREDAEFRVTNVGGGGGFIGYNDTAGGCATGVVELVDRAAMRFEAGDLSLGYSSTSGASFGRLSLADDARLEMNAGALIRVGRTAGCRGELLLNGGEVLAKRIFSVDGDGVLSADGGLFNSSSASTSASDAAIIGLSTAELGAAGLCFSNNVNSVVSQAFTDKSGAAGLFAKSGLGTLTVLADSSHARTEIRGGKIVLGTGVSTFGRNLTVADGLSADFSAAGLEVESLTVGSGASLTLTAGNPVVVTTAGGLTLGGEVVITLANATSTGTFTLFETVDGLSAADLAKLKVVSAESDYFYTLSLDGTNVRLVTEYHVATEKTWDGSVSGAWSVGGNWSGDAAPYPNDTALFGDAATTKAVVIDSAARIGTASFAGSTSFYSLAGSGTLSGDLALGGGTLSLLSPAVVAPGGAMTMTCGTLEGDAEGLSISRSLTTINSDYPVVVRATKDMALSTALDTTKGGLLKLGAAKLSMSLPAGSHRLTTTTSAGATGNLTGQPALDEYGNMTGWGGCVGVNVFDGTLEISGAGSTATTLNLTRIVAVGSRCVRTAPPALVLKNVAFASTGAMMVGAYSTSDQVSCPPSIVLADDVSCSVGGSFYLGYHDTQRGASYLTVSNSTLAVAGGCWIPESAPTDFSGTSTVFVCRGGRIVSTSASADAGKGIHLGKCRMRIEDGGELDGGSLMPITFDRANKDTAEILALRGGVIRAAGFLGANTNYVTKTSSVTAGGTVVALDGGTVELVASGVSQSANPDRNYLRLDAGGGTFSVGEGLVHRIAMPVKGAGALTKAGAGVLRLAKVVDRQADDYITELADSAAQWTGGTCVAEGVLDIGGEAVDFGAFTGGGTVSNGTVTCALELADAGAALPTFSDVSFARVNVVFSGAVEPAVGTSLALARLSGSTAAADLSNWRAPRGLRTASVAFSIRDGVVYADIVDKRGSLLIVR